MPLLTEKLRPFPLLTRPVGGCGVVHLCHACSWQNSAPVASQGRPTTYCFVTFSSAREADEVLEELNGRRFADREGYFKLNV